MGAMKLIYNISLIRIVSMNLFPCNEYIIKKNLKEKKMISPNKNE
jgi:hypothetical protein